MKAKIFCFERLPNEFESKVSFEVVVSDEMEQLLLDKFRDNELVEIELKLK